MFRITLPYIWLIPNIFIYGFVEDCEDIDEDEGDNVVADDIIDDVVVEIDAGVSVDGEYADEGIEVEIFSFSHLSLVYGEPPLHIQFGYFLHCSEQPSPLY